MPVTKHRPDFGVFPQLLWFTQDLVSCHEQIVPTEHRDSAVSRASGFSEELNGVPIPR